MSINFAEELNPSQLRAVEYNEGPSLVIAGAGSGKTRVLTYKIAYLLETEYSPWNILALTFTNKAAREMRERIARLVGDEQARPLWMGTFHSIFARILRTEAETIGFQPNFTIYDAQDSQSLVKLIIREMGLDDKKYKPSLVASRISEAKNNVILPSAYANDYQIRQRDKAQDVGAIYEIYSRYNERLRQSNAMDFDDLLLHTYLLLKEHEDIRLRYAERFKYILVDEYQDTNHVQDQIVWLLAKDHQHLSVVGDDAQSIYSFRGARIDNILDYQKHYTNVQVFKLEQNYRSTQTIVNAANSLISNNRRQIHKNVFSEKAVGEHITLCETYSEKDEADTVTRRIVELNKRLGYDWNDVAILYRTNSQSRPFEESLKRNRVPYHIYGGLSFYQRKEIKDALAYFRLSVNVYDVEALRRVINYPGRGIGDTTVQRVLNCATLHQVSPWEVVSNPDGYQLEANNGTKRRLIAFAQLILSFKELAETADAYQVALHIMTASGMRDDLFAHKEPEDISRQENVQELVDSIKAFVEDNTESAEGTLMSDYLQTVSLLSDLDNEGDEEETSRITLMTVHAAKGLEFRAVFVVGLEEDLFPSEHAKESPRELEEERRLMYVAMTRAEERLFLTYSHSRIRYGRFVNNQRSRFLREIAANYMQKAGAAAMPFSTSQEKPAQSMLRSTSIYAKNDLNISKDSTRSMLRVGPHNPLPASLGNKNGDTEYEIGCHVIHERFGEGVVQEVIDSGLDAKIVVRFTNSGTKTLMTRFAKLTKI